MALCTCFFPPHNCGSHLKALGPVSTDHYVPIGADNFCSVIPYKPVDPRKTENVREHGVEKLFSYHMFQTNLYWH